MSDFKKLVAYCRKHDRTRTIWNASRDHATVLFEALIEEAVIQREDIKITTGNFDPAFYGLLKESIIGAMKKGVGVEVIVETPNVDLSGHPLAEAIKSQGGHVYTSRTKEDFPHFILVGKSSFRMETDHDQTKAMASFDNSIMGSFLLSNFDILKDRALPA